MIEDVIKEIQQKGKIVDILKERGITPSRYYSGKSIYKCPIHKGDNSPSFYVYEKDSGDDFFCYGCKAGGNVVQLVKLLDSCNYKDALSTLGKFLGVDIDSSVFNFELNFNIDPPNTSSEDIDGVMSEITLSFRKFRQFEVSEKIKIIEQNWNSIDECYWNNDIIKLKEISKWILGK